MINELEIALRCAPALSEADQAKLADAIFAALERQGWIERERLDTIAF